MDEAEVRRRMNFGLEKIDDDFREGSKFLSSCVFDSEGKRRRGSFEKSQIKNICGIALRYIERIKIYGEFFPDDDSYSGILEDLMRIKNAYEKS